MIIVNTDNSYDDNNNYTTRIRPSAASHDTVVYHGTAGGQPTTANHRTNIMDFRGSDSSIILSLRGGIPMPIGDFPESLSQAMLVGVMLVGRWGVHAYDRPREARPLWTGNQ